MNATRAQQPLTQVLLGAAAGAALGLVGWFATARFTAMPDLLTPSYAAAFVLVAAAVCGVGRLLCGGLIGPMIGVVLGFAAGVALLQTPRELPKPKPLATSVELAGPTLAGPTIDLASLRGKVVLVDFWATWCQPCVAEMPNLRALHSKHGGDDFTIIGVSLDRERDKLERFIKTNDIGWPQVFFPEQDQGQSSPLVRQHRVDAIPHTLLVDREGKLAAVGLRGDEIESAVKLLLAGKEVTQPEPPLIPSPAWWLAVVGGLFGALIQSGAFVQSAGRSK